MPNRTIYVSESDIPLFEEAQELTGGNLSGIIAKALRHYVQAEQAGQDGFDEIILKVNPDGFFTKKKFRGRLLTRVRYREVRAGGDRALAYQVYTTPKGKWVVHFKDVPAWWYRPEEYVRAFRSDWQGTASPAERETLFNQEYAYRMAIYDTEEELRTHLPEQVYQAVRLALAGQGGDVEELDL